MASQISDPVTLGKELARAGRKQEAYQVLRRALFAIGDDPEIRFWLAAVAPTPAEAVEHLERCLDLDPENARAHSGLVWAKQQLANWEAKQAEAAAAPPPTPVAPAPPVEQYYAAPQAPVEQQYAAPQPAPMPQFGAAPLGFGNDLPPLPEPTPMPAAPEQQQAPDMSAINEKWPGLSFSTPSYDPPPASPGWAQPETAPAPAALPDSTQLWGDLASYGSTPTATPAPTAPGNQSAYSTMSGYGASSYALPDETEDDGGFDMIAAAEAHSTYGSEEEAQPAAAPWIDNSVPANVPATNAAPPVALARKPDTGPFKRPSLIPTTCPRCGAVARSQDRFCQSCGQALDAPPGGELAPAPMALPPGMPDPAPTMVEDPRQLSNKMSLLNKSRGGAKVPFAPDKIRQEGAKKKPMSRGILIAAVGLLGLLAVVFGVTKLMGNNSGAGAAPAPVAQATAAPDQAAGVAGDTNAEPTATVWTAEMSAAATTTAVADAQATVTAQAAATAQTEANDFGREMSGLLSDVDSQDAEFERALAGFRASPDEYNATMDQLDAIMRQNDTYKKQLAKMKPPDSQHRQYVAITQAIGHRGEALVNAGKLMDLVYQVELLAEATTAAGTKYQTALNHYNSTKAAVDYADVVRAKTTYSDLRDQLDRQLTYADQTGKKYDQEWNDYRDLVPVMEKEQLH